MCLALVAHAQSADPKYFLTWAEPLLQKKTQNPNLQASVSSGKLLEGLRGAQQSVLHADHADAVVN